VKGRKSPSTIDLAHGLYNSLYYRTSRDIAGHCHCHFRMTIDNRVKSTQLNGEASARSKPTILAKMSLGIKNNIHRRQP